MENLVMEKRGQKYVILDGDKVVAKLSAAKRAYVAVMVYRALDGGYHVQYRFGRLDLIGKGESKNAIGRPNYHIVYLKS